jgi:MarR family transcriptional regulator, transcriptional regulator for hemolysin
MDTLRIPAGPPAHMPIGMLVARVGKSLDRAFDDALAAAGGTRPTWLVLLAVKSGAGATQATLARHVGISGPTLLHHLDRLEADGLVARTRDPANRRPYTIALTAAGEDLFLTLREAAIAFDHRLRDGLSERRITDLRHTLGVLGKNVESSTSPTPEPTRSAPR